MTLLTKIELLRGDLVDFTADHKDVATNSLKIAESLENRHHYITRKVDSLLKKGLIDKRELSLIYFVDSSNRKQKAYDLNEKVALQVVMGLSGQKAERLHKEIARGFVTMKSELHAWQKGRHLACDTTKSTNDQLYQLRTELNEAMPESKKGVLLFNHVQIAINKAVTGIGKSIDRNTLPVAHIKDIEQLVQAVSAHINQARFNGVEPEQLHGDELAMIKATGKKKVPTSDQSERDLDNAA